MEQRNFFDAVANVVYYDITVSEFEPKSSYYVHFRASIPEKGINLLLTPATG